MENISFSESVKEDIASRIGNARHCQLAELAALLVHTAQVNGEGDLLIQTEHELIRQKIFTLLNKAFHINKPLQEQSFGEDLSELARKCLRVDEQCRIDSRDAEKILQAVKWNEIKGNAVSPILLKQSCCKRAFLQDSFLCMGSISDPKKSYHAEFVCAYQAQAEQLQGLLREFEIEAKITTRKKYYILYLKDGAAIIELLNIIGAHKALMEMENLRILKDVRNDVNRRCNCDSANINKTLKAAEKQIADIEFLRDFYGLDRLPDNLKEVAAVRLENPDISLKELGEMMDPPVGKSGVNHRLRKLSELAEKYR